MQAALSQRVALAQAPRAARAARGSVKVMAKTVSGKTVSGKAKTVKGGAASSSSDLTPGQECESHVLPCSIARRAVPKASIPSRKRGGGAGSAMCGGFARTRPAALKHAASLPLPPEASSL